VFFLRMVFFAPKKPFNVNF